jgi:hypothetical protein
VILDIKTLSGPIKHRDRERKRNPGAAITDKCDEYSLANSGKDKEILQYRWDHPGKQNQQNGTYQQQQLVSKKEKGLNSRGETIAKYREQGSDDYHQEHYQPSHISNLTGAMSFFDALFPTLSFFRKRPHCRI